MEAIRQKAYEVADLIQKSEVFLQYKKLRDEIFENEGSKKLINDYKKLQFEAQTALLMGRKLSPELEEKLQKTGEVLQFDPKIAEYFSAEYRFNSLISEVYKIIVDSCDVGVDIFQE